MQPPQYPYLSPQSPTSQRRSPWSWYRSQRCFPQFALGCGALVAPVFVGIICSASIVAIAPGLNTNSSTPTTVSQVQSTTISAPTSRPTSAPTATMAPPATKTASVTYGRPHLGGPFSDFVGKYGTPQRDQTFWADAAQTIWLGVENDAHGIVTRVTVSGPDSWKDVNTQNSCEQFLTDDASQFNRTPGAEPVYIDYHSSLGEIVMQLSTPTCLIFVGQS